MILKTERTKLKRILKSRYIGDVLLLLSEKGITNANGEPFSKAFISYVFNGKEEHQEIEDVIFELYDQRKAKLSKMKVKRKMILKK